MKYQIRNLSKNLYESAESVVQKKKYSVKRCVLCGEPIINF